MIALLPTREDARRLAIEGGEEAEQLHLTLRYLGNGADFNEASRAAIVDSVRMLAEGMPPITSNIFGAAHWNGNSDEPSWVWSVGDDLEHGQSLEAAHGMAEEALLMAPMDMELPAPHTPWVAHVCAAYSDELDLIIPMEERLGPVTFDRIRVAFAGDHADIPLADGMTAAAGPLRRKPTDLELASRCDFADMNDAWHQAVDDTVEQWAAIQAAQREQITAAVQAAVDAGDIDRLTTTTVSTTDAANLLFGRMQAFAVAAGEAQQREAEAQGVDVPEWSLDDEALTAAAIRDRLRQVATTTARLLGLGLVQSAVRRAVQLFGSGTGAEIAARVDEHLAGLSGAAVEEQVGAAMTAAQNEGRMAVLAVAPPATYTASEALDRNSCSPCRQVDGTQYATLAAARAAYPTGGYVGCEGGPRCRGTLVTVWPEDGEQNAAGMILAASGDTMPPTHDQGGGHMPYDVVQDHPDCAADTPWAVTKQGTGELMGCHAAEDDARKQMAALHAEEGDSEEMPDGEDMPKSMDYSGETAPWEGVLAVEGITTGDGREFAPDALTWADLPVPLRWNIEDSHGGDPHTVAVNVGRIDRIWRDGNKIMGAGVLDLSDSNGQRAYDKIKGGFLRGVSIDADSIADADVELVWPDDANEGLADEDDLFEMLFAQPEKTIFHAGRIRAATLVDIPAFAEAYVALLDEQGAVVAGGQPVGEAAILGRFGAVGSHDTSTSDGDWDGPANEARLPSPMPVATARNAYAWIDDSRVEDGELVKDAGRFIHHEVSADGRPGAANLTACSTGIGILNGGRGGTTIPAADRQGVYDHLAAHLRDADREPPPLQAQVKDAVTAAAVWQPPAEWFADPKLSLPTPITITDDGRIYGHAAQWGSCHIGQEGACIKPPREAEHPYYRTGEVVCADGSRVAVGQITVGTGHAPLHYGASPAAEHYDNTGAAVADVAVGNDQHGIWVAGSIRPGADPLRVYELQAAGQVSGDWRRIGGQLRLVGLLAVNVPGFPVPKMRARVASGQPQALVAAGRPTVGGGMSQVELEQWATRVVMRMLSRQVHPGGGDR
jgi:2'-5' RNA ligase